MPESQRPRKPMNPVPIEDRPRSQAYKTGYKIGSKIGTFTRRNALPFAAGAATGGSAVHIAHRAKQKEKTVASKNLINPFEEVVVFGKAYPVALPVPRSTTIRALVPTGSHVGHGNALTHVHNSKGGGGRATRLERYTGKSTKKSSKDISPVHKALSRVPRAGSEQAGAVWRQMSPVNRRGRTAGTRDAVTAMRNQARGRTTNFQDPGSTGRRLT